MTGPEHYRRAEQLAEQSRGQEAEHAAYTVHLAQVHATLALAAATAIQPHRFGAARPEWAEWADVAGHREVAP